MSTTSPVTSPPDATPSVADVDRVEPTATRLLVRRVAARVTDMVTVLFICLALVIIGLAPLMNHLSDRFDPAPWHRAFAATVLYTLVGTIYEVAFLVARGQTPGKDLMNVRVVDAGTGATPGWMAAIARTTPFALARLVPGVWLGTAACLVLGVSAPSDPRRRGLHDLLAHTCVEYYDADQDDDDGQDRREPPRRLGRDERDDLVDRYGPRSLWGQVARWMER